MTRIRVATKLDRENIREVYLQAFSEGEKQIVSTLAINLLSEQTNPEITTLVAETDVASRYSPPYKLQYPFGWQAMSVRITHSESLNTDASDVGAG